MSLYITKKDHHLLVEIYKYLCTDGSRPDLADALYGTIDRLDKKLEREERKEPRQAGPAKPTGDERSLMVRLLDAGYPVEEIDHHGSDLYVYVTPQTAEIVHRWCRENGYSRDWHCPTFRDQTTGRMMFDCAFQYNEEELERWTKSKN